MTICPNVIVAGAQKSGTTSLCAALEQHPACVVSNPKEPNFFSVARNEGRLSALAEHFRHANGTETVRVDGTTTYMADARIAPRIHAMLGGDLKIIFTLRSPAKRAWSGYLHMLKRGHERRSAETVFLALPDVAEEAAAVERARTEAAASARQVVVGPYRKQYDDTLWNFRYLGNSLFREQVEPYDRLFGRERVLVLLFEDLIADFRAEREKLAAFLGIDAHALPDALPKENATRMPNTRTLMGRLDAQARRFKNGNFTIVRKAEGEAPAKAPAEIAAKLTALTAPETAYWSDRLGRDLRAIGW